MGIKIICGVCGHLWGAYEDTCHCPDGKCHNQDACAARKRSLAPKLDDGRCLCGNCVGDGFDAWVCNET